MFTHVTGCLIPFSGIGRDHVPSLHLLKDQQKREGQYRSKNRACIPIIQNPRKRLPINGIERLEHVRKVH